MERSSPNVRHTPKSCMRTLQFCTGVSCSTSLRSMKCPCQNQLCSCKLEKANTFLCSCGGSNSVNLSSDAFFEPSHLISTWLQLPVFKDALFVWSCREDGPVSARKRAPKHLDEVFWGLQCEQILGFWTPIKESAKRGPPVTGPSCNRTAPCELTHSWRWKKKFCCNFHSNCFTAGQERSESPPPL